MYFVYRGVLESTDASSCAVCEATRHEKSRGWNVASASFTGVALSNVRSVTGKLKSVRATKHCHMLQPLSCVTITSSIPRSTQNLHTFTEKPTKPINYTWTTRTSSVQIAKQKMHWKWMHLWLLAYHVSSSLSNFKRNSNYMCPLLFPKKKKYAA